MDYYFQRNDDLSRMDDVYELLSLELEKSFELMLQYGKIRLNYHNSLSTKSTPHPYAASDTDLSRGNWGK